MMATKVEQFRAVYELLTERLTDSFIRGEAVQARLEEAEAVRARLDEAEAAQARLERASKAYVMQIEELQRMLAFYEQRLASSGAERDALLAQLTQIHASHSWRCTRPCREALRALRAFNRQARSWARFASRKDMGE